MFAVAVVPAVVFVAVVAGVVLATAAVVAVSVTGVQSSL
jgi:hypothetical protein